MVKVLRLAGVVLAVWGLGLLWPEVNQVFLSWLTVVVTSLLGAMVLASVLVRRLDNSHDENGADSDQPTRPMPVSAAQ
jgi:phosphate/sulfate permease